jgi:hypothetical protein
MAASTLTLLVLTLTGQVVELRSDKPSVTPQESARIEVRVLDGAGRPVRDAEVSLTVNVGSLTEPAPTEDGWLSATYQPPTQEEPQVAVLHAAVRQGSASSGGWLSLPVHGRQELSVQAPPRSRVRVSIGSASFGPVTATASGTAKVPVDLPPGAVSAEVTTVDRAGRSRTQTLPLPAPRFARLRLVALEAPSPTRPVRLQGFVVDESGNPAVPLPPVAVSAERGTLGPVEPGEGGRFEVPYTAPQQATGPVRISGYTLEEPERSSSFEFEPLPGAVAALPSPAPRQAPAPGRGPGTAGVHQRAPWEPSLGALLFLQSNAAFSNSIGARLEGSLRVAELPLEAILQLEGRRNREETEPFTLEGLGTVNKSFTLRGFGARAGGRWSHPVLSQGLLFADVSAGILRMSGRVSLEGPEGTFTRSLRSTGPALSMGGGLGWALGRGRLTGQLQWSFAPGQGRVRGNLGGVVMGLGYQLPLKGASVP